MKIKYLPSSPSSPIIPEHVAYRQREEDSFAISGLLLTALGLGIFGVFYLSGRRRRERTA